MGSLSIRTGKKVWTKAGGPLNSLPPLRCTCNAPTTFRKKSCISTKPSTRHDRQSDTMSGVFQPGKASGVSQPTREVHPMLVRCWSAVCDAVPAPNQHRWTSLCSLGDACGTTWLAAGRRESKATKHGSHNTVMQYGGLTMLRSVVGQTLH